MKCWSRRTLESTVVAAALVASCGGSETSPNPVTLPDASDQSAPDASSCTPKSCEQLGVECGRVLDDCGGITQCGGCTSGLVCGGDGENRCGTHLCKPKTCMQLEASCGLVSDGCADVLDCGYCPAPRVCGAGGKPNQCACTPKTCAQLGASCGLTVDTCGGVIECGSCSQGQTCGAAGQNKCGTGSCTAKTCAQVGASCGIASDGCSDVIDCGACTAPNVCGGGGVVNQCGCSNKTCAQLGASCGVVSGGCGTDVQCGSCPADDTCGGGGITNHCGCSCQLPHATTTCAGTPCHISYCDEGWGDCDGSQATGCETDLMGGVDCPIPCTNDDPCPQSYSCVANLCVPWPLGILAPWGGSTLPNGWLEADGSAVSRAAWSALFNAIGTSFGAGDGSTTFNLPDLRGRFALGPTKSGTGSTLAESFGTLDHEHLANLTPHTHTLSVASHAHGMDALPPHAHDWYFTLALNANPGPNPVFLKSQVGTSEPATGGPFTTSTDPGGPLTTSSNASLATLAGANPPYIALRWIILAKPGGETPCGALWFHAHDAPPAGAVSADGAAASRTSDAYLFGCLQTTFGVGDGATTFNLPDVRGRSALGKTASSTGSQLGETGGALEHKHTSTINAAAHSLLLPAHSHTAAEPAHIHAVISPPPQYSVASGYQFGCVTGLEPNTSSSPGATATSSTEPAASLTAASAGPVTAISGSATAPFLAMRPVMFRASSHRLPAGTVSAFAGAKVPFGWLLADGSAVSRSAHAPLFAAIGTAFGSGDGSTTFNLPDLGGRTALGKADSGPASLFAASGGALDHVHDLLVPAHVHSVAFPSHTHLFNFYHHVHTLGHTQIIATDDFAAVESARGVGAQVQSGGMASATSKPASAASTTTSSGGGEPLTTQPSNGPYLVVRYIIHE